MLHEISYVHRCLFFCGFLCFLLAAMPADSPRISKKAAVLLKEGAIHGITLGMHSTDYSYSYLPLLEEIKETDAKWLSLNIKFYQDALHSSEILEPSLLFWERLETTLKEAKSLNFKVLLLPIVLIQNPKPGEWRGKIKPLDRKAWYESYSCLITNIGVLAEKYQVEMLSIGSEFCSMEVDRLQWESIIKNVKQGYKGALTYSVNWDSVENIEFQNELDFLGLTGYFELAKHENPTVDELTLAWLPIREYLLFQQDKMNVPFIFTEVGYTSLNGTSMHPWNYKVSTKIDLKEQKDCYTAFSRIWRKESKLYGVFFYDWFGIGGKKDKGYTIRQKPALEVAKKWFDME